MRLTRIVKLAYHDRRVFCSYYQGERCNVLSPLSRKTLTLYCTDPLTFRAAGVPGRRRGALCVTAWPGSAPENGKCIPGGDVAHFYPPKRAPLPLKYWLCLDIKKTEVHEEILIGEKPKYKESPGGVGVYDISGRDIWRHLPDKIGEGLSRRDNSFTHGNLQKEETSTENKVLKFLGF